MESDEQVIWKFELPVTDRAVIPIPTGASVLGVGVQGNIPVLWALVNPGAPAFERTFEIYGTGHTCSRLRSEFIGTFQLDLPGGQFVGHVFEPPILAKKKTSK